MRSTEGRLVPAWVLAVVLVTVSLGAGSAAATDWYVDPTAPGPGLGTVDEPFALIASATDASSPGDRILLAAGVYSATRSLEINGQPRRALLVLPAGVEIVGTGRASTFLEAPATDGPLIFGITAEGVGRDTIVRDLAVRGPCFQGVNLRGASPTLLRLDLQTELVGGSSTSFDARDGSDPLCRDVLFDGGHSPLFVEFGSSGRYEDCVVGRRPNEGVAISQADPVFVRCVFEGAGRDLVVLNQGSQPRFSLCEFGRGDRWTVRVASGYEPNTVVDLGGNRWFTTDLTELWEATLDARDNAALGAIVRFDPVLEPVVTEELTVGRWKALYDASPR